MRKLITNIGAVPDVNDAEKIRLIRQAGFDGVFTGWHREDGNRELANVIRGEGLFYHSIHAPFNRMDKIWEEGEEGDEEVTRQISVLEDASAIGVDLVVMHTIIGMDKHTPNEIGVERYLRIFREAKRLGVRIALENTEGAEYLDALMKASENDGNVGFCIDTGHEMCYNCSNDMIGKYGDRLFSTHLNDNMGITGEEITWLDDAHLLPFDGIADWQEIANRLKGCGYDGDLTFEVSKKGKPGRTCNDRYLSLSYSEYISEAYRKATMFLNYLEK